ncbi:MAG: ABC-2 type transport system ATP-binding protein [Candidatus Omnitrophota bacterium]|jgi:ABC-2 type transport system ATP-binding protein
MIKVNNISKQFGQLQVLKNINFSINKGEIVGFLGVNGAGKTTMMRILTSYLPASSGDVSIAGYDVRTQHRQVRENIGYLPENPPLYFTMRVGEYLKFAARLKNVPGKTFKQTVDKAISQCQLQNVRERPIGVLSKGFKQRVGIAQAILNNPKVLILDEPTTGLDPLQVNHVQKLLNELKEEHTVILSTHVLSEIEQIAQRIIILKDGQVALDKTTEELLKEDLTLKQTFTRVHGVV